MPFQPISSIPNNQGVPDPRQYSSSDVIAQMGQLRQNQQALEQKNTEMMMNTMMMSQKLNQERQIAMTGKMTALLQLQELNRHNATEEGLSQQQKDIETRGQNQRNSGGQILGPGGQELGQYTGQSVGPKFTPLPGVSDAGKVTDAHTQAIVAHTAFNDAMTDIGVIYHKAGDTGIQGKWITGANNKLQAFSGNDPQLEQAVNDLVTKAGAAARGDFGSGRLPLFLETLEMEKLPGYFNNKDEIARRASIFEMMNKPNVDATTTKFNNEYAVYPRSGSLSFDKNIPPLLSWDKVKRMSLEDLNPPGYEPIGKKADNPGIGNTPNPENAPITDDQFFSPQR
jgi:hypothetical protein